MIACLYCGIEQEKAVYARCKRDAEFHGIKLVTVTDFEEQVHLWKYAKIYDQFYGRGVSDIIGRVNDAIQHRNPKQPNHKRAKKRSAPKNNRCTIQHDH